MKKLLFHRKKKEPALPENARRESPSEALIAFVYGRRPGMELVQVAILVAIAIVIGLIFRTQIESFVNGVFEDLSSSKFK